jgi:hypothetical protein
MRLKGYLFLLLGLFCVQSGFAQKKSEYTTSRILILLDRSSSMIQAWSGGKSKSKAADQLILKLMDSIYAINPDVEFSLRVFGHQYTVPEQNCHDTKNEVPFQKDNRTRMAYRLEDIKPLGVTSIAYSLQEAAEHDLVDEANNAYSILLITDGGESCGGDICEVMKRLVNNKIFFKPYIISLEDFAPLKATYACMGNYLQVLKDGDITPAIGVIVDAFKPVLRIKTKDFKELQTIAANAPSVLKVNVPVTPPPPPPPPPPVAPSKPPASYIAGINPRDLNLFNANPESSRKLFKSTVPKFEPIKVEEDAPPAPIIVEQPVRPAAENISSLRTTKLKKAAIAEPVAIAVHTVNVPRYEPLIIEEVPERQAPQKISRISLASLRSAQVDAPKLSRAKLTTEAPMPPLVLMVEPAVAPKVVDKITKINPLRLHQFGIIWVVEEHSFPTRPVPPLPPLKIDIPAIKIAPKKTISIKEPEGKTLDYITDRSEAKETTLEVFLTDGRGKFYETTPQILLLDVVTGNPVKRFYRTVDPNGNPDPQTGIPPGTYNLTFSESRGLFVRNVTVEVNQKNKITVKVPNASLSFEYGDNHGRPVSEFVATVIERNKPNGKIRNQKGTEKLEYEPGNYHVIINTFPQEVRNIDLDFSEKVIDIPQQGFANFSAEAGITSLTLYQRLGDKFLAFHTFATIDPSLSHLQMYPGEYQAHYRKGPGGPSASEKVIPFIIRSTQDTKIELK